MQGTEFKDNKEAKTIAQDMRVQLDMACEPGMRMLQEFTKLRDEYMEASMPCLMQQLRKAGQPCSDMEELSKTYAYLPDLYDKYRVIAEVLGAWQSNLSSVGYGYCVQEHRYAYTAVRTLNAGQPSQKTARIYRKDLLSIAEKLAPAPGQKTVLPKWIRVSMGKLKLVPVGHYVGGAGLHAAKDLFFVYRSTKPTGESK
tara:strand:+ start:48 stop:644 length:597 start_codon:yes stop_codon:yes gene_type:complete